MTLSPRNYLRLFLLLLLAAIQTACSVAQAESLPYVDLTERSAAPLPTPAHGAALHLAVAAIISPRGNIESYKSLAGYLSKQLDRHVDIAQRRTYAEINELIAKQQVDVGFVCTSAYVTGHDQFGMQLLAAPQIDGETVYYAELIVPADSPARSIADLRGKVFAFTDPMSFSGRVYPTYLLSQLNEKPETFFSRTFFTYSHDKAIQAVAEGVADGATVDSMVLEYAIKRDPTLRNRIRVIRRSPPFGIPPVVVPPNLSTGEKLRLQEILLTMHDSPEGRQVLEELGIDRFVLINDSAYETARTLMHAVGATSSHP